MVYVLAVSVLLNAVLVGALAMQLIGLLKITRAIDAVRALMRMTPDELAAFIVEAEAEKDWAVTTNARKH